MLKRENFSIEHIRELQKQSDRDPILIERVLYAFGLLEALVHVGTPFIFKGGTCLMLLLEHPMRLSTDIDIIVKPGTDIDDFIAKVSVIFPFAHFEEQRRIGRNNIEKRHFKFYYKSPMMDDEFHIILDVLFEENNYSNLVQREISNELLLVEEPKMYVQVPNANCILGDKLTAFAPHTTGIPFGVNKELEIMKQLYDVATLTDVLDDFGEVKNTYRKICAEEIAYRGLNITYEDVLRDTIRAAVTIIDKGFTDKVEYPLYMYGAKSLRNHVYVEKYSGEKASIQACKVLCLAACVLADKDEMVRIDNPAKYIDVQVPMKEYAKMSYMKKQMLEAYGYIVEGVRILDDLGK